MRPDLADVRLADRVFAPHYAAPLPRRLARSAPLRAAADVDAPVLATLDAGDRFEMLEVTDDSAWGVASDRQLVGYLDAAALERA